MFFFYLFANISDSLVIVFSLASVPWVSTPQPFVLTLLQALGLSSFIVAPIVVHTSGVSSDELHVTHLQRMETRNFTATTLALRFLTVQE